MTSGKQTGVGAAWLGCFAVTMILSNGGKFHRYGCVFSNRWEVCGWQPAVRRTLDSRGQQLGDHPKDLHQESSRIVAGKSRHGL
ncbi:hypothetical protein NL676_024985 [Syzygium grande]|nr:hypothetical protein NL676_024985 [Syzygium grande]